MQSGQSETMQSGQSGQSGQPSLDSLDTVWTQSGRSLDAVWMVRPANAIVIILRTSVVQRGAARAFFHPHRPPEQPRIRFLLIKRELDHAAAVRVVWMRSGFLHARRGPDPAGAPVWTVRTRSGRGPDGLDLVRERT